jgi:hypothetical protein
MVSKNVSINNVAAYELRVLDLVPNKGSVILFSISRLALYLTQPTSLSSWNVKLLLHMVPSLKMCAVLPSLPLYIFMA